MVEAFRDTSSNSSSGMTEGMEDYSPETASPTGPPPDTGPVPEEKPEETEAAGESADEGVKGITEEGRGDGEQEGALEMVALPATCCVCIEMEQINRCLHSEKICILPILACLLSLALCTAGLKWVFVDKIFEYEPLTQLDPKPIGQDPITILVNPALGITVSLPHSAPSTVSLTTTIAITPGYPEVYEKDRSTARPFVPQSPQVTYPTVSLKYDGHSTVPKPSSNPQTTQDFNKLIQTISTTSTSTTAKSSSHIMRCSNSQKTYCVNGGECFTLEIMPGSTKFLCRCPSEFTGDRCQTYVMASYYKTEELYQKRILTITGICIALLIVGIMCVVAYCKTNKQRKKLRDRLRQSQKKKRKNNPNTANGSGTESSATGRQNVPLQDLKIVNPCNGSAGQHATEETETTFPSSKYATANQPTTLTNISSQRFQLSPDSKTALSTPASPPSEMSAPLSSLAVSVPSVALSPSLEEDRPLLLSKKSQQTMSSRLADQKSSFSHYNHGHAAHSLPPSPALHAKNVTFGTPGDRDAAASYSFSELPEKLTNRLDSSRKCISQRAACRVLCSMESNDSMLFSETDEPHGGDGHFLTADSTAALWDTGSSRTNPASPSHALHLQPHNPIAV
ncbi:PREDICTED: pro-neuregulin-1, membrane-bound isoform-like isoform X2 [Cyprinodon variegatus]|uniref:Pro-neuregulin-1, membrane-bound isoform-like n=1 Tax=Cyprinodon variegatus TaxID=28743 RepID=A0A3Q2EHI5_CYPVA|nr:PREDICTED: pro-neuregulin-1, membrane-bound isoform-like isoform X2 [Cyprinodon variegatus]